MTQRLDRRGTEIHEGDFIIVSPVNVMRFEDMEPDAQILGRVRLLKGLQAEIGIVQWPAAHDDVDPTPPLVLEDYFRCSEAVVLLKANGLPPSL
jgi:hypothetical protein